MSASDGIVIGAAAADLHAGEALDEPVEQLALGDDERLRWPVVHVLCSTVPLSPRAATSWKTPVWPPPASRRRPSTRSSVTASVTSSLDSGKSSAVGASAGSAGGTTASTSTTNDSASPGWMTSPSAAASP